MYELLEDRDGRLWISTLGSGASRFDGETFTAFGAEQGLTRTHVQDFYEDRDGALWLGCSGGLFRLDGDAFVNVTRGGPWRATPAAEREDALDPLGSFARLVDGEWRMGRAGRWIQFDTWTWGLGPRLGSQRHVRLRRDRRAVARGRRLLPTSGNRRRAHA